jgi:hypothetical protein
MDLNALRSKRTTTKATELEDAVSVTLDAIDEIAEGGMPHALKLHVFNQVGDLLTNVQLTGVIDPGSLASKPIAALSAGTTAPTSTTTTAPPTNSVSDDSVAKLEAMARSIGRDVDGVVDLLVALIGPLDGKSPQQQRARAAAMQDIANGVMPVKDDGTPKVQEDLDEANQKVADLQDELRTLHRNVDPILTPLNALTDATEKSNRMNFIQNVARNGIPTPPPPDARISELEDIVTDVKDHLRPARMIGSGKVLETSTLKDETKTALGL